MTTPPGTANDAVRSWAVVPAAGIGARMNAALPKQYLPLAGRTVIEHALAPFLVHPRISGVVVALAAGDAHWPRVAPHGDTRVYLVEGGAQRCHSVLNALDHLAALAGEHDWVLVHDAARPCLRRADLDALFEQLEGHAVGGLLGVPVSDTVKRCTDAGDVVETVEREGLWRALTPQMFRFALLREALRGAIAGGFAVTDEAAAMEWAGHAPHMVLGHADNIKVTHPRDLQLAELYLRQQESPACE